MPRGVYTRFPKPTKDYEYESCLDCKGRKETPHYQGQRWCNACRDARLMLRRKRHLQGAWERMIYQRYKLRPETYKKKLKEQKGRCAICRKKTKRRLCVDHNHKTKRKRGLLCFKCNTSLGYIEARPVWLRKAKAYFDEVQIKWLVRNAGAMRIRDTSSTPAKPKLSTITSSWPSGY